MRMMLFLLLTFMVTACEKESDNGNPQVQVNDDFENGKNGWEAGFAEYFINEEERFELQSGIRNLPQPLNTGKQGYYLSGRNLSDDLFMFLAKEITGLAPNTNYEARFTIHLASNAPSDAVGIGGAPGESVHLGIGVVNKEPVTTNGDRLVEVNIDKSNQQSDGPDRKVIGNIANGKSLDNTEYVLLQKQGTFEFTTGADGRVWAMVSTDSGFEGATSLYYDAIEVTFNKM